MRPALRDFLRLTKSTKNVFASQPYIVRVRVILFVFVLVVDYLMLLRLIA
jgi:hypothetical protein